MCPGMVDVQNIRIRLSCSHIILVTGTPTATVRPRMSLCSPLTKHCCGSGITKSASVIIASTVAKCPMTKASSFAPAPCKSPKSWLAKVCSCIDNIEESHSALELCSLLPRRSQSGTWRCSRRSCGNLLKDCYSHVRYLSHDFVCMNMRNRMHSPTV